MLAPRRFETRADWLAARRIGSSDVAAVLGLSTWAGPVDVWERLVYGQREAPTSPDQERGQRLEPRILATYEHLTGQRVEPQPLTLYAREEWATVTPDALAHDPDRGLIAVEAKSDRLAERWGIPPEGLIERWSPGLGDVIRRDYYLQTQYQCWVLDARGADLAVLVPGDDPFLPELRVYRLLRDDELVERLADRLRGWWRRHVVAGEPPPLDDSPAAARLLAAADRGSRTATPREVELARAYAAAAVEEKAAKERKRAIGRELIRSAGTARQLEIPRGGRVSIVAGASRGELDEGALLHARPDLEPVLAEYRRPGSAFVYPRVAGLR